jgi:uncharacterized Ntn-hydrolase superfamily protein
MTYSIVARDPATGDLGVAVQTCWFSVGALVPWAVAGVGAVATQAMVEVAYGPRCLEKLEAGLDAAAALDEVRGGDEGSSVRQVAVVDASGAAAAFTGAQCIAYAGHHTGDGYSVEANMMASADVWPAMAEAYETSTGSLPDRLFAALVAGEAAGGDARGNMSAAMLVVKGERQAQPWEGRIVDVRVDHHDRPLDELARLLRVADAFAHVEAGEEALFGGDAAEALRQVETALGRLPGDENARFLRAGALLVSGQSNAGLDELRSLIAGRPSWGTVIRSFATQDLLPLPDGVDIDALTAG